MHKLSEKLTIADLARWDDTSTESQTGDLTVMVSAVIPVPEGLRTTGTPLGFLRVWDGTGPGATDP